MVRCGCLKDVFGLLSNAKKSVYRYNTVGRNKTYFRLVSKKFSGTHFELCVKIKEKFQLSCTCPLNP